MDRQVLCGDRLQGSPWRGPWSYLWSGWEEEAVGGRECGDSRVHALGEGSGLSEQEGQ